MERLIFRLRARDARREGLSAAAFNAAIAVFAFFLTSSGSGPVSALRLIGLLALISGVFGCVLGLIQAVRGRERGDIELDGDVLRAFPGDRSKRRVSVQLTDIRGLLVRANQNGARAFIGHRTGTIVLDARDFADPEDLARLTLALRERIRHLPNGLERLAYLEEQMEIARFTAARRPIVTYVMLGLITVAFGLQVRTGALQNPLEMMRLGAGVPALIAEGEWFRLISANFLHGADFHVFMNGLCLWIIGSLIERIVGGWQLAVIAFVSALGGAATSTVLSEAPIMVGASTTLYGLFGALIVIERVYRWQIPPLFRESIRWLIILLVVNVIFTLPIPQIDKAAHGGGLVAGALAMFLMIPKDRRYRPRAAVGRGIRAVTIGLCVLFAAGLFGAMRSAANFNAAAALTVLRDEPSLTAGMLNDTAWMTLIQPDADPETLAICLEMAQLAVERAPEEIPAFLDTRAGALYRNGRAVEAVPDQLRAMSLDTAGRGIYVAHLRRIARSLPVLDGLSRDGDALRVDPMHGGKTLVGSIEDGGMRAVFIGRPDAQGQMAIERAAISQSATISLHWIGSADVGDLAGDGQWTWFVQAQPGKLP